MVVQLEFENPLDISMGSTRDLLVAVVKNVSAFISEKDLQPIDESKTTMKKQLPRMMAMGSSAATLIE